MTNRREFIKQGGVVAGAIAAEAALKKAGAAVHASPPLSGPRETTDAATRDLMMDALNAAKLAGAEYADVRIGRYQQNFVQTREQQIVNVADTDSIGAGVRALVDRRRRPRSRRGNVGLRRDAGHDERRNR